MFISLCAEWTRISTDRAHEIAWALRFICSDCDLISLLHGVEAEGFELGLRGGAGQPAQEVAGELLVGAGFQDDGGLLDGGVCVGGDADEGAELAEVFARGDREGDEAGLGVAGLGELRGLAMFSAMASLGWSCV